MKSVIDGLFRSLVDYAGLFPPASLSLEETLSNYEDYRSQTDAPMLGRLILPISKFGEAADLLTERGEKERIPVSALFPRQADVAEYRQKVEELLPVVAASLRDASYPLLPQVLEMPLHDELGDAASETDLGAFVQMLRSAWEHYGLDLPVFLEPPMGGDFILLIDGMTAILAAHNQTAQAPVLGWKLRCGGLHESAFPDSDTVSRLLVAAGRRGVPTKATAGLHHPWPQMDEPTGARMHGFVNLLAAAALARRQPADRTAVMAVLDEDDRDAFAFDADGLHWRDDLIGLDAIREMRDHGFTSFGSCSFDEPRQDLRRHGIPLEFSPSAP